MSNKNANKNAKLVFYGEHTASLSLYLDGLPPDLAAVVRIVRPHSLLTDLPVLAAAGLVIHVRSFDTALHGDIDAALIRLGVPRAWFTDDDLLALALDQPGFASYSSARLRAFTASLVAVIGTTRGLCERLAAFHPRVLHWPCVADSSLLPPVEMPQPDRLRVAVFGGAFRAQGLRRSVLPALAALPGAELVVTDALASSAPGAMILPFEPDFRRFIQAWRHARPAIVVHPPGIAANLPAKGPGSVLAALYLGAVPVVAEEPAFAGLHAAHGVLRAAQDPESWHAALASLASPQARQRCLAALATHCTATYTAGPAADAIAVLQGHAAPAGEAAARRRAAWLLAARQRISHHLGMRMGRRGGVRSL